jgi:hypothetical protein
MPMLEYGSQFNQKTKKKFIMAKKKRTKKMSQEKRSQFAQTFSLNSLSPTNRGFNQKNQRSVKIHIPRKPK